METVIALLTHHMGPAGTSIPRDRPVKLVDHRLMPLLTGTRTAK